MATTAREIMSDDCTCIGEQDTIKETASLLAKLDVGAVPICGTDDRLKGMITDRDIVVGVLAQGRDPAEVKAGELANGPPVMIEADAPVDEAIETMSRHKVRRLPVIEDKRLVGMVSQADIAANVDPARVGELVGAISTAAPNN
jgi:CBS domain-containing protein